MFVAQSEQGMRAAAPADRGAEEQEQTALDQSASRPSNLLAATADRHPHRLAFGDQPNREAWSGRPRIAWTYANTHRIVERLATVLAGLSLPQGTPFGICLPNSSEACVALLAVERAGYVPCLLSSSWSEETIGSAIELASLSGVICQGQLADQRPADMFCRLAARYFGLRFVCAFGPRVPDGVIDLDRAILDTPSDPPLLDASASGGLVTFQAGAESLRPVFRPYHSAVAAAVAFLVVEKIDAGARILSLLATDDHRGLTIGLMTSLVAGVTLETQGLFDSSSLQEALAIDAPTHLVAPAWLEPALAQANLPDHVVSTVLVHEVPVRFKIRGALDRPVTDVLSFGEIALVAWARGQSGHLTFSLDADGSLEDTPGDLLRVSRDEDGRLHFAGAAAEIYEFHKGAPIIPAQSPVWRTSGFMADLFAGIVIGVR
jgi:hypothetical protein